MTNKTNKHQKIKFIEALKHELKTINPDIDFNGVIAELTLSAIESLFDKLASLLSLQQQWEQKIKPERVSKYNHEIQTLTESINRIKKQLSIEQKIQNEKLKQFKESSPNIEDALLYSHIKRWTDSGFRTLLSLQKRLDKLQDELWKLNHSTNFYSIASDGSLIDKSNETNKIFENIQNHLQGNFYTSIAREKLKKLISQSQGEDDDELF
ncbi:hypothetical protein BCF59_0486 [Mycoplasmopsis mustelae]|uniref:Uncharacterized protein n=1 Tax=Mycoplasmopsis mustelae TaxID=171289 RepID=A0A4R7UC48_9BACT|nr:hypothetical protein [Mycoplasmopsis mustelae]TDV23497.1 hypothetical protein BCF59_0486 [Mycoplasmopsis mustelae]